MEREGHCNFNWSVLSSLIEEVTFEQRLEGSERASDAATWGTATWRRDSQYKSLVVAVRLRAVRTAWSVVAGGEESSR